jgi:hypothetical protein
MTYVDQTRRPDDSARSELLDGRAADRVLLDEFFSGVDLAWIRADCAIALRDTRLDSDRAALLVAAIDEGLANAVRHGGGEGRLVLLYDGGEVVAHISDRGAAPARRAGRSRLVDVAADGGPVDPYVGTSGNSSAPGGGGLRVRTSCAGQRTHGLTGGTDRAAFTNDSFGVTVSSTPAATDMYGGDRLTLSIPPPHGFGSTTAEARSQT